jgi:hypothetical protein
MFRDRIMRKSLIIFGVLLLLSFGVYQLVRIKRVSKTDYTVFNSRRLDGKIIRVSTSGGLSFFKLDNADEKYSFMPIAVESNKDKLFHIIAAPGDSIFKMPYSDTLLLTHKGHKYYYTFNKF